MRLRVIPRDVAIDDLMNSMVFIGSSFVRGDPLRVKGMVLFGVGSRRGRKKPHL